MTRIERYRRANQGPAPTPTAPTPAKPGTAAKLAAMAARVEAGEGLFHPHDAGHDGTSAAAFVSRKGAYRRGVPSSPRVFAVLLTGDYSSEGEL